MTSDLSRNQLRSAHRVAARLHANGKGAVIVVVGRSAERRRAFEATLADAGITLASGTIDDSQGPWLQIAAIAGERATASISWTANADAQRRIVEALNLGREAIHELPAGLLLWVGGLDAIENFPAIAPDLWAYRVAVIWVLSTEDFEAEVVVNPEMTLQAELRRHEEALANLASNDVNRIWELLDYAVRASDAGQLAAARRAVAEAEHLWSSTPEPDRIGNSSLEESLFCARVDQTKSYLRDEDAWAMVNAVDWRASGDVRVARMAARYVAGLAMVRGDDGLAEEAYRIAARYPWDGLNRGFMLTDFCRFLVDDVGDIVGALDMCHEAEAAVEGNYLDWMLLLSATEARAEVATLHLRQFDAVAEFHRAWISCLKHGDRMRAFKLLPRVVRAYQSIGLAADTLTWFDDSPEDAGPRAEVFVTLGWDADARDNLLRLSVGFDPESASLDQVVTHFQRLGALFTVLDGMLDHQVFADIRALAIIQMDALIDKARSNRQTRVVQNASVWRVRFLLELGRLDEAEARLAELLSWSERYEGPRLRAQRHLESARLALARHDPDRAESAVDRAERALLEEREHLQSRYVWREILETRAEVLAAQSKFEEARATLHAARDRMHAATLEREALRIRQRLAEPLPGEPATPDALADREQAALEALRISSAASLVYEEARALANVALIHAERGRADPARKMLAEAIRLAEGHLGLRAHLECRAELVHDRIHAPR
jgi:tetratricopeptide (TPR) repeat protein